MITVLHAGRSWRDRERVCKRRKIKKQKKSNISTGYNFPCPAGRIWSLLPQTLVWSATSLSLYSKKPLCEFCILYSVLPQVKPESLLLQTLLFNLYTHKPLSVFQSACIPHVKCQPVAWVGATETNT